MSENDDTRTDTEIPVASRAPKKRTGVPQSGFFLDNRFRLKTPIGEGGMGFVFKAWHVALADDCAIKILPKSQGEDSVEAQRFVSEARITFKLKHKNIVEVIDAGISNEGYRYIVMELLQGETLDSWIDSTPVEERDESFVFELLQILNDVCSGLSVAHHKDIIHRDLKPTNIFLHTNSDQGSDIRVPKILDFGIAKQIGLDGPKLTATGDILGTAEYMSPEQIRGEVPDPKWDIYAIGIILYEALTGVSPFQAKGQPISMVQALDPNHKVEAPSKKNPKVSAALDRLTLKAIERLPENRFQSIIELMDALSDFLLTRPKTESSAMLEAPSEVLSKRTRQLAFGVVILISVAIFVCMALMWNDGQSEKDNEPTDKQLVPVPIANEKPAIKKNTQPLVEPETVPTSTEEQDTHDEAKASPVLPKPKPPLPTPPANVVTPETEDTAENQQETFGQLILDGEKALGAMDYALATQLFNEALQIQPTNARAWYNRGRVSFEQDKYPLAAEQIRKALTYQNRAKWQILLGQALLNSNKKTEAIEAWKYVIDTASSGTMAWKAAKQLLAENGVNTQ